MLLKLVADFQMHFLPGFCFGILELKCAVKRSSGDPPQYWPRDPPNQPPPPTPNQDQQNQGVQDLLQTFLVSQKNKTW